MLVTMAQISVYDILKQAIVKDHKLLEDGTIAHFTCAFFAGFTASVVTNPVDVVKSRIMGSSSGKEVVTKRNFDGCQKLQSTPELLTVLSKSPKVKAWRVCIRVSYPILCDLARKPS